MSKLYDLLKCRKDNGENLSINDLDDVMLWELWCEESIPDSCIAELYSVSKEKIRQLRYRYGIKQQDCILSKVFSKLSDNSFSVNL